MRSKPRVKPREMTRIYAEGWANNFVERMMHDLGHSVQRIRILVYSLGKEVEFQAPGTQEKLEKIGYVADEMATTLRLVRFLASPKGRMVCHFVVDVLQPTMSLAARNIPQFRLAIDRSALEDPPVRPFMTEDFEAIMKQFLGYLNRANVTIVDLSGIPFEVLSITVSLVSRLIFDFCFHYTKLRHEKNALNDVPVMIVCEEAHNYIPQRDDAAYRSSRKSLERVAKEGRKYGLSLMVVSQRPSEVSETIFAQCNNFLALRLTNNADQMYVRRLFPDNSSGITDILPNLAPGECVVVGDAVLLPAVVQMPLPSPEPHSRSVLVHQEWKELWRDVTFSDVISRWRKE